MFSMQNVSNLVSIISPLDDLKVETTIFVPLFIESITIKVTVVS